MPDNSDLYHGNRNANNLRREEEVVRMRAAILILVLVTLILLGAPGSFAAGNASFNSASSAVTQAFVGVQSAGKEGGNVTSLIVELNGALALIQKASTENSTNPSQAVVDLNSAVAIAEGAQASASTIAIQGTSAKQVRLYVSVLSAVVIVSIAGAIYVFGDKIYRGLWLRIYGDHVVRKVG